MSMISLLIMSSIRSTTPIALAAIGGAYSARTGTMALGMEGFMLIGAFASVAGSYFTNNAYLGLLIGLITAGLYSLLFAVLSITFKVNQVIAGIGMNMLASGITATATQIIWGTRAYSATVASLGHFKLPLIGDISAIIPTAIIIGIVGWFVMFQTPTGLRLRFVGENPVAAISQGIAVKKYRYWGVIVCGLLCGLAGAFLSIDHVNRFVREMTAGRGYIAVAVNILGKFNPAGALWGGLLFGLVDSIDMVIPSENIPAQLLEMIPYLTTLLIVVFGMRYVHAPAGLGMSEND